MEILDRSTHLKRGLQAGSSYSWEIPLGPPQIQLATSIIIQSSILLEECAWMFSNSHHSPPLSISTVLTSVHLVTSEPNPDG